MVWGQLRSVGVQVTRERVRSALRQTDPLNTALRWRGSLTRRRAYSVPGPNMAYRYTCEPRGFIVITYI